MSKRALYFASRPRAGMEPLCDDEDNMTCNLTGSLLTPRLPVMREACTCPEIMTQGIPEECCACKAYRAQNPHMGHSKRKARSTLRLSTLLKRLDNARKRLASCAERVGALQCEICALERRKVALGGVPTLVTRLPDKRITCPQCPDAHGIEIVDASLTMADILARLKTIRHDRRNLSRAALYHRNTMEALAKECARLEQDSTLDTPA